jgi:NAD(P)-dependent dehydrogenase (short-subunit alcohol dehydrogenase family)
MTVVENEGGSAAGVAERVPGLACKRILVTGGASGIGRSTALIAARSGAQVLVGDVNAEALKQLRQQAADGGLDIATTVLDTSSPQSVEQFLSAAQSPLHGLVCAAGIAPDAGTLDLDLDAWTRVLSVNLTGAFLLAQGAIRQMLEHGHGGSIVMLGSNMGSTGWHRRAGEKPCPRIRFAPHPGQHRLTRWYQHAPIPGPDARGQDPRERRAHAPGPAR